MTTLYFANRGLLIRTLSAGAVPLAVVRAPVRFAVDDVGGFWVEPSATLTKQTMTALTKLGGGVRKATMELSRSASCWAEMVPMEPAADEPAERALLEWIDIANMPRWSAQLRRLGARLTGWRIESEPDRVLALIDHAPFHALAQPLPTGWRAFVEQTPRFWVEHGFRHPLKINCESHEHVLVRHDGRWEHIAPLESVEHQRTFTLPVVVETIGGDQPISIPIKPRLIDDPRPSAPTFWVLPGTGESVLTAWLQHTDDRLVRQLQVARISTDAGARIVLLANADSDRAPLLLLDAAGYQQYLKLNNLFVPLGTRLSPALRRDVARRTYAPRNDHLVWLDGDESRGITSSTIPLSAFRPLFEMVQYQSPSKITREIETPKSLFTIQPFVVRDRPAPKLRPKPAVAVTMEDPTDDKPGLLDTLFGWVKGAWQITTTVTSPPVALEKASPISDVSLPPPSASVERATVDWRDQADSVRTRIHTGKPVTVESLADLARTGLREQRIADAAWCWQQVLWQADQSHPAAATGWVQCETLLANAGKSPLPTTRGEWTVGQLAANVVRWSFAADPWPVPVDAALRHLVAHDAGLSIKAAWLAHLALARQAGNDVLTLARTRDRLFARLLEHGLRLEIDVPAFLRSEDAERGERLSAVRDWLVKSQDSVARWLGERTTGLTTERLAVGDRLERFGLSRERINTVYYAHLMIGWGLATIGATTAAVQLADSALSRLPLDEPIHAWLAEAFRLRIEQAGQGGRAATRWPDELHARWRQLPYEKRVAVDRFRQRIRILEPLEIVDAFDIDDNSSLAPLAHVRDADLANTVNTILRQTRPTSAARLPVLTQALRVAPQAGEALVRSLVDQLLLELEPFTGSEIQWAGMQAGLGAVAAMQLPELAQRLLDRWLDWSRRAEQPTPGLDRTLVIAIPALQRLNQESALSDLVAATNRLTPEVSGATNRNPLVDQTRIALAGGLLAIGHDDAAMIILDDTRRLLFHQNNFSDRDRLALAIHYVESLRYAPVRVAIGRHDELMQRLPPPRDSFTTNAYYALSSLRLLDAMIRSAANENLTLGSRVRRWLDSEEYAIRRRIQRDVAELMSSGSQSR